MDQMTEINLKLEIKSCSFSDTDKILELYEAARQLQTRKNMVVWPVFERSLVEKEIQEEKQWKLVMDNEIACNWAVTFADKEIWEEKDNNDSVYIHRIATNPAFRGRRFINEIVSWAKVYAISKGKQYVRLDTLGNNTRLIEHYVSAGFNFLGMFKLRNTKNLPAHYQREPNCCLFEIAIN
jgi:ribosomal protein S18 acetylase RimI-like enzyme